MDSNLNTATINQNVKEAINETKLPYTSPTLTTLIIEDIAGGSLSIQEADGGNGLLS